MGEFVNGTINNLIAAFVAIFTVRLMVKNDSKSDSNERIAHAEKHATIEQRLNEYDSKFLKVDSKIAGVEGDIYMELKDNRELFERRFTELNQLIVQLIKEKG